MIREKFHAYLIEALKGAVFALSLGVATAFMIVICEGLL